MAPNFSSMIPVLHIVALVMAISVGSLNASDPPLTLNYYAKSCPTIFEIVRKEMECAVLSDPRNAALIVRLHFHDCFVQGCDGSVLLDDTITVKSEKNAATAVNSLDGFDLVDRIKNKLESECPEIVSCADLLTLAARDAVVLVGGPYWEVPFGRKDSINANLELANANIPGADETLVSIIQKFLYQGLSVTDTVALSGAHTIGMARCENFRQRIYGDFALKNPLRQNYLNNLMTICPAAGGGDNNITAMDYVTPNLFDNSFFHLLLKNEGLLSSDQILYSSPLALQTRQIVKKYAANSLAFFEQFSDSMVKMGNITNSESFVTGQVRKSCRFVNT